MSAWFDRAAVRSGFAAVVVLASGAAAAAPVGLNTVPNLNLTLGGIELPKPLQDPIRGPYTPGNGDGAPTITVHFDPLGISGPRPPKDEAFVAFTNYFQSLSSLSSIQLNLIVPDAQRSAFDGIVDQLSAALALASSSISLNFITPDSLNTCFANVGVPGDGTTGGFTPINTCIPQTPPAPIAGIGVAYYMGLFDWSDFRADNYVYSLVNLGAMLYLDASSFDPSHVAVDPALGFDPATDKFQRSFRVTSYDPSTGTFAGVARIPEPGSMLLVASALAALWSAGRRRSARR
jgi:hypothetical protein